MAPRMENWKSKLKLRVPALLLLLASLLFWPFYDRYETTGPALVSEPNLADATRVRGESSLEAEGFRLHVPEGGAAARINFRMPQATRHELIRVRGQLRTEGVVEGRYSWRCARLLLVQYDENNKWISGPHGLVSERGTTSWVEREDVFEVFPNAARVDVVLEQCGTAGTVWFSQVEAEPVRLRSSFVGWRIGFALAWLGAAVLYFRRCRLHVRRLRVLILLNVIAIIFGALMPGVWMEGLGEGLRDVADTARAAMSEPVQVPKSAPGATPSEQQLIDRFNDAVGDIHSIGHFTLFASLCFLVYLSGMLEGRRLRYYIKVGFDLLLFAVISESLQFLTVDRTAGISDFVVDLQGMGVALLLFVLLLLTRRLAGKAGHIDLPHPAA